MHHLMLVTFSWYLRLFPPKKQWNFPSSYFLGSQDVFQDSVCSLINTFQKFRGEAEQRNCLQVRSWPRGHLQHQPTQRTCAPTPRECMWRPSSWSSASFPRSSQTCVAHYMRHLRIGGDLIPPESNKPFKFVLGAEWAGSDLRLEWKCCSDAFGSQGQAVSPDYAYGAAEHPGIIPQMAIWSVWELLKLEWSSSWAPHSWMCHRRVWFLQLCTASLQVALPEVPLLFAETSSLADCVLTPALLIPILLTWVLTWTMGHESRYLF